MSEKSALPGCLYRLLPSWMKPPTKISPPYHDPLPPLIPPTPGGTMERLRTGANWSELKDRLAQVGVVVPEDFNLDESVPRKYINLKDHREFEDMVPEFFPYYNGRVAISFHDFYVHFEGQSLSVHAPKYREAVFLQLLDVLGLEVEESLKVEFVRKEPADPFDPTNTYQKLFNISFLWSGWRFQTIEGSGVVSYTEGPNITREDVLKELQTFRERKF